MSTEPQENIRLESEMIYGLHIKGHLIKLSLEEATKLRNLLSSKLGVEQPNLDMYKLWQYPTHPPFQHPHSPYQPLWEVRPQDLPQYATNPYQTTGIESTPKTNGIELTVLATTTTTETKTAD